MVSRYPPPLDRPLLGGSRPPGVHFGGGLILAQTLIQKGPNFFRPPGPEGQGYTYRGVHWGRVMVFWRTHTKKNATKAIYGVIHKIKGVSDKGGGSRTYHSLLTWGSLSTLKKKTSQQLSKSPPQVGTCSRRARLSNGPGVRTDCHRSLQKLQPDYPKTFLWNNNKKIKKCGKVAVRRGGGGVGQGRLLGKGCIRGTLELYKTVPLH
jgi:hypothetical protein